MSTGVRWRAKWMMAVAVPALAGFIFFIFDFGNDGLFPHVQSERMSSYAKRYSKSVAFVAVEYWLKNGSELIHHELTFGTAFLADSEGRLLTNRHVTCPWLVDPIFESCIEEAKESGGCPDFGYRLWVWFDGAHAMRRVRDEFEDPQLSDLFYADTAYRSDGAPSVAIVGVLPIPVAPSQKRDATLEDDVAVLQVTPAPLGLKPLLLKSARNHQLEILAPVLALGFPMGVSTMPNQEIAVSATVGHVRRCFSNVIQTDVSLHPGNSGGPVLDAQGRVIGIASSVCREEAFFFSAPQSDMGQILPLPCAEALLRDVASGKPQWDGMIDPSLDGKLSRLLELSRLGGRHGACELESAMKGVYPERLIVGAALQYGDGNLDGALTRLRLLLEAQPDHHEAALLRLLLMRNRLAAFDSAEAARLMSLDWRSEDEFFGYLARVLAGKVPLSETQDAWDDPTERAWLDLVVGLLYKDKRDNEMAEGLFRKALLGFDNVTWQKDLARSELEKVQTVRSDFCRTDVERRRYDAEIAAFVRREEAKGRAQRESEELSCKYQRLCSLEGEVKALAIMSRLDPLDSQYPIALLFELAKKGEWHKALECCERLRVPRGRESANRLGIGLLHAQLLRLTGRSAEALSVLRTFRDTTSDPWYRDLARMLLGEITAGSLEKRAGASPANLVTYHTALGLQAEADNNPTQAVEHYLQALDSSLKEWYEYNLAKARIEKLRGKG